MREIPDKIDSKFRFVLLAASRAEQILQGAAPKLDAPGLKPTRVAMREIGEDRIDWDYGSPAGSETPEAESESASE